MAHYSWISTCSWLLQIVQFGSNLAAIGLYTPVANSTVDHLLKNEFIGGQDNAGKVVNVTVTTGQLFRSTTSLAWLIPKRYYLELCVK